MLDKPMCSRWHVPLGGDFFRVAMAKFQLGAAAMTIGLSASIGTALAQANDAVDLYESQLQFSMAETLSFTPNFLSVDSADYGQWSAQGVATGMAFNQTNPIIDDANHYANFSNAQVLIQKTSGPVQIFAQSGLYAIPTVGFSYVKPQQMTQQTFGYLPQAYVSIIPNADWTISVGKLPSPGGVESTFTYQNINIQRGLLWAETNSVSRGVQVSNTTGPLKTALYWNDGAYSNVYNWLGASASFEASARQTVSFIWTGSLSGNSANTPVTPLLQNNSQIYNLIYAYASDRWAISPYLQYTTVPTNTAIGINGQSDTKGVAVLGTYHIAPLVDGKAPRSHPSVSARLEYMASGGNSQVESIPSGLLYGPGSSAWSATVTPTYMYDKLFVRAEFAYVKAFGYTAGSAFGLSGQNSDQTRVMIEAGLLF